MTFVPQNDDRMCFIACEQYKIDTGQCSCHNRVMNPSTKYNIFDILLNIKKEVSVEVQGWRVTEKMKHTDGNIYFRVDCSDDGIEWYEDNGYQGILEYRISNDNPELAEELENTYIESKQGYTNIWDKK